MAELYQTQQDIGKFSKRYAAEVARLIPFRL